MFCNKCKTVRVRRSVDPVTGEVTEQKHVIQGRVFVDRIFSERKHVELFCINCGARWMLDKTKNVFAAWVVKTERAHADAVTIVGKAA